MRLTTKQEFRNYKDGISLRTLSELGQISPHYLNKIIQLYDQPIMQKLTEGLGYVYQTDQKASINSMAYTYTIKGVPNYLTRISVSATPNSNLGRNGEEFSICVVKNIANKNDIIHLENGQQLYVTNSFRKLGDGRFEYSVKHISNSGEAVDTNYLQSERTVSVLANAQPEMSSEGYHTEYKNEEKHIAYLQTLRVGQQVSGHALNQEYIVMDSYKDKTEKAMFTMSELEKNLMFDLFMKREQAIIFQKSSVSGDANNNLGITHLQDSVGRDIQTMEGIIPQIEKYGLTDTYTNFTEDTFIDMINNVLRRMPFKENAEITLMTGVQGMKLLNKVFTNTLQGFTATDAVYFTKDKSNTVTMGANFRKYMYQGSMITVVRNNVFDWVDGMADEKDSEGYPSRSSMFLMMDTSKYNGVPNIQVLTKDGYNLITNYTLGLGGKDGKTSGSFASPVHASRVDLLTTVGVAVHVPQSCILLKKAIL